MKKTVLTRLIAFGLISGVIFLISSCSHAKSPVEPDSSADLPISFGIPGEAGNHNVVAVYDLIIDPVNQTVTLVPCVERSSDYHFPLNTYYPNVLSITGYGFSPNLWANIKLKHPYPHSGIDGYDARVIAVLPARTGVSMNYPTLGVQGNNAVVMNPDGYTKLFDNTSIPGNVNPFIAYFKTRPYRVWSSNGVTEETIKWDMKLTGFGGSILYKLVVDVSTHYPSAPLPIVDNAPEPVAMDAVTGEGLSPSGGDAEIDVTLLAWHGTSGIGKVLVEAPDIFDGTVQLAYAEPGTNQYEYIYTATISNTHHAPAGQYKLLVSASDSGNSFFMMKEFSYSVVEEIPSNPTDITPPWLNFSPYDVCIDGNYAYAASDINGLHIFNISDRYNPTWVGKVAMPGKAIDICTSGNYAYVVIQPDKLVIVDKSVPESAYIINTIPSPNPGSLLQAVSASGGYAYIADFTCFFVADVDPPGSASIIKSISTTFQNNGIYATGGYLYLTSVSEISIYNITTPSNPGLVKNIDSYGYNNDIFVSNGYGYVAADAYLSIIDVDPPSSAYVVNSVLLPGYMAQDVSLAGHYVYIADQEGGLVIVDVEDIMNLNIVQTIPTPSLAYGVSAVGNTAIAADMYSGLYVVDITDPPSANVISTAYTPCASAGIDVSGNYTFIADYENGLYIFNTDHPEDAHLIKQVPTPSGALGVFVDNNYAYVADNEQGIQVININPPGNAGIVKSIVLPGVTSGVFVRDGYAFAACGDLKIIDIDPLDQASIVGGVFTSGYATNVFVLDNYAYVADSSAGLTIVDITDVTNAFIAKIVNTPGSANGVYVTNGYAYVADHLGGFQIISVSPVSSAHIVKTVATVDQALDVRVNGDYAYVALFNGDLDIMKINPPESAYLFSSLSLQGSAQGVHVSDGKAYVADYNGGFRIVDLW